MPCGHWLITSLASASSRTWPPWTPNAPAKAEGLRERKKRQMRQQLTDTATEMFVERGFDTVRVAEIAEVCGVSEKTGRCQAVDAPPASNSSLLRTSVGFNQSSVCRGRLLSSSATASSSGCV